MGLRIGRKKQAGTSQVSDIDINDILDNPYQNRSLIQDESLEELASSIQMHGILQPVLLRMKDHKYYLVSGDRRIRAAKRVGLKTVPAVVREMSDVEAASATLVENLQRENVSFLDEAVGFANLNNEFGLTQNEIGKLVGKSQSYIANKIRLLNLHEDVRRIISQEIFITERHCRALLRLPCKETQLLLMEEIVSKQLNTQQTDRRVEKILQQTAGGEKKQNRILIVKDIRIFLNSIKAAIEALHETGIETDWEQEEDDEYYQFQIKIRK